MQKKLLCFQFFAVISLFLGCSNGFLNTAEVMDFYLPQWPPEYGDSAFYPALSKWQIQVCSCNSKNEFYADKLTEKISLEVQKNKPLCIYAKPITLRSDNKECSFFKGAGALYPYKKDTDRKIILTWEDGFVSELMLDFYSAYYDCDYGEAALWDFMASFNWKKLQENLREKIQNSTETAFYNPWFINKETVIKTIGNSSFKMTYCNLKNIEYFEVNKFNENLLSPFIPENEYIKSYGKISFKTDEVNLFSLYNLYGIIVKGSLEKNLSVQQIYLPIFIEDI